MNFHRLEELLAKKEKAKEEIIEIYDQLQLVKFFQDYAVRGKADEIQQIIKRSKLQKYSKDHCIIEIDVKSEYFYIILSGQVGFYIPKPKKGKDEESAPRKFFSKEEKMRDSLHLVKALKKGEAFGESSLLYNRGSDGSMFCMEETYCLVLDRHAFMEIIGTEERDCITKEVAFLQNHPLFEHWSFNLLRLLYFFSERVTFNKDEVVFLEGSKASHVYIVKQGEFAIYCNQDRQKIVDEQKKEAADKKGDDGFSDDEEDNSTNALADENRLKINSEKNKKYKLGVIGQGEIFGEEDILMKRNRSFSVICETYSGKAQLIVIKRQVFKLSIMADIKSSYQIKARLKQKIINHKQRLESISSFLKEYKDYCFEDREGIEKKLALSRNLNTEGARPVSAQPPGQLKDSRIQYLKNTPGGEGGGVPSVLAVTKQDDQLKLNMFGSAPKLEDKFMMNEKGRISRDIQPTAGEQNTARSGSNNHKATVVTSAAVDSQNQQPQKDIPTGKNKKQPSISVSQFHTLSKGNSENFEIRHTISDLKQMNSLSKARSQSQQSSDNNSRNLKMSNNFEESQHYGSTSEQKMQINSPSKLENQKKEERRKSYFLQEANMKQAESENHGSSLLKRHIQSASSYSLRVQSKDQEKKTKPPLAMQDEYFASTGDIKNNSLNSKNHIKFEITEENQQSQPSEPQNAQGTQENVLDTAENCAPETNTITPQDSPKKAVSVYLHEGESNSATNMDRKLKKLNLQSLLEKNNLSQQNKNSNQFIPSLAGINMHSSSQTPGGNSSSRSSYHNAIYGDSQDHLEAFSKQFLNSQMAGNFTNYPRFNTLDVLNTNEDAEIPTQANNELNSQNNQPNNNNNEPQQNNDQEKKTTKPKKFRNSIFTEQFKKTFQSNLRQIQFRALKKTTQVNDIQQSIAKHIQDSTIKHFLEENSLLKKQAKNVAAAKALPSKTESTPASIRQVLKTVFNTSSSDILSQNRFQNSSSPIKGTKTDQQNNNNNNNNVPLLQKFAFTNRVIGSRILEQNTPLSNQVLVKYHSNYVSSSESATKSPTSRDNHQETQSQQKTNDRSRTSINSMYLKQQLQQQQPSSAQQQMRPLYKFQEMMKNDNLHRDYADSARSLPSLVSMKSEGTAIQIKLIQGSNNNLHCSTPSDGLFNFVSSLKIHDPTPITSNAFEGLSESFSPNAASWEPHSSLLSRTKNKVQQLSQKNTKPSLKLKRI